MPLPTTICLETVFLSVDTKKNRIHHWTSTHNINTHTHIHTQIYTHVGETHPFIHISIFSCAKRYDYLFRIKFVLLIRQWSSSQHRNPNSLKTLRHTHASYYAFDVATPYRVLCENKFSENGIQHISGLYVYIILIACVCGWRRRRRRNVHPLPVSSTTTPRQFVVKKFMMRRCRRRGASGLLEYEAVASVVVWHRHRRQPDTQDENHFYLIVRTTLRYLHVCVVLGHVLRCYTRGISNNSHMYFLHVSYIH